MARAASSSRGRNETRLQVFSSCLGNFHKYHKAPLYVIVLTLCHKCGHMNSWKLVGRKLKQEMGTQTGNVRAHCVAAAKYIDLAGGPLSKERSCLSTAKRSSYIASCPGLRARIASLFPGAHQQMHEMKLASFPDIGPPYKTFPGTMFFGPHSTHRSVVITKHGHAFCSEVW